MRNHRTAEVDRSGPWELRSMHRVLLICTEAQDNCGQPPRVLIKQVFPERIPDAAAVTKIAADGSHIEYSTFLGPAAGTAPAAITVNASGEAWVTGAWAGPDFPLTSDAYSNHLNSYAAPYLSN